MECLPMLQVLFCFFALAMCLPAVDPFYLGVLEPPLKDPAAGQNSFRLRAAFHFDGKQWSAMSPVVGEPAHATWSIVREGRKIATVETLPSIDSILIADVGLRPLKAHDGPKLPTDGFVSWLGDYRYRLLAATTANRFEDPDRWTRRSGDRSLPPEARREFRRAVADSDCSTFTNLRRSATSYTSNSGTSLIAIRSDSQGPYCGPQLFFVQGAKWTSIGEDLRLIEAADFDGDGHTELLLQYDGYNRNGYVLIRLPGLERIEFLWSYH